MGSSSSKNKVEETTKMMISDAVQTAQSASAQTVANNTLNISNCNISNSEINQTASITLSMDVLQSSTTTTEMQQTLYDNIDLYTKNITKGTNLDSETTKNVTELTQQLTVAVAKSFNDTCDFSAIATNNITADNCNMDSVTINQNAYIDNIYNCTQLLDDVTQTSADLNDAISSQMVSKLKSNSLIFIFIIIGVVILGKIYKQFTTDGTGKKNIVGSFITIAIVGLVIYLIVS